LTQLFRYDIEPAMETMILAIAARAIIAAARHAAGLPAAR
jgi:hypothetical protein